MLIVGADDALHQVVPHHVAFVKVDEREPFDVLQNVHSFQQAAAPRTGQVNLRDIARDHRLGVESEAGDEHFHLLRGRILGLVEDHE